MKKEYLAHSDSESGPAHLLRDHLRSVSELAAGFAAPWAPAEAGLAGLLHDLGKYGGLFQKRLADPHRVTGVDHWTMGAWAAAKGYSRAAVAAALAIAGHHLGLSAIANSTLNGYNPAEYDERQRKLSEKNLEALLQRLDGDGLELPLAEGFAGEATKSLARPPAAAMLDFRMLFSALVDADFLDTEAHFQRGPDKVKRLRPAGPELNPGWAAGVLAEYIQGLAAESRADAEINRLRADLLAACRRAAASPPGQFTLSAPTGAGKTLAMLAFALQHAAAHNLRRVVMVIPYLTIIDQTARVFRRVFADRLPAAVPVEHYVLEQHSMAGLRGGGDYAVDRVELRRRALAENWDAPIIVTTSVQMLESLFSHRPGACRKLHRLAQSVILFDEVQTLPSHLAGATLAALARLAERFGGSVVFSTATQPAFEELNPKVERLGGLPWKPSEIAGPGLDLFKRAERVKVHWPEPGEELTLAQAAEELAGEANQQSLCVVNLKRQAIGILRELQGQGAEGLCHLSTSMCPAHRDQVLARVRERLDDPARPPVRLVSTQCVEAGVDLDFPVVYRAWGPLTAIAQAAGRCNRNGRLESGQVRVFRPNEVDEESGRRLRLYPDDAYKQAAEVTGIVGNSLQPAILDINNPEHFAAYYRLLYTVNNAHEMGEKGLDDAVLHLHFKDTAEHYRLINQDAINVLVPFDAAAFDELAAEAREQGLSRSWMARARPHTVGLWRPNRHAPVRDILEPIPIIGRASRQRRDESDDWFICMAPEAYDDLLGFNQHTQLGLLEV